MKNHLPKFILTALLFVMLIPVFAQAPPLGTAAAFSLYTGKGAFTNNGASQIYGNIGTNEGALTGFPPGNLIGGQSFVADAVTIQAKTDVQAAYDAMTNLPCPGSLSATFGAGQTFLPNTYCIGSAATLTGNLILDAQNDPTKLFMFKIGGKLAVDGNVNVTFINGATPANLTGKPPAKW